MNFEVGVVIPTFNRAALLDETLTSILAQSLQPAEVIVVDDGSTDETEAVVRRYGSRIHYHRIENSGQARARNVCVSLSTTPWLAFCDDDDLWRPEYLASYARLFGSQPQIQYAFCNFVHVRDGKWEDRTKFDTAPPGFWDIPKQDLDSPAWIFTEPLYAHIVRFQPIFLSTIVLSRNYFERIGRFDESFSRTVSEDFEFTLRCVQESPVGCVREPLVGIRKHDSNFSGNELSNLLGSITILRHALQHHAYAKKCCDIIENEIITRSRVAAELAFAERKLEIVRQLCHSIPRHEGTTRLAVKHFVSRLPGPLARAAASSLLAISHARLVRRQPR